MMISKASKQGEFFSGPPETHISMMILQAEQVLKRRSAATPVFCFVVGHTTVFAGLCTAVSWEALTMVTEQTVRAPSDAFAMSVWILVVLQTIPFPDSIFVMWFYDPERLT